MRIDLQNRRLGTPQPFQTQARPSGAAGAFTLVEVVVSVALISVLVSGMLGAYVQSAVRADWAACSLSAEMMAISGMEQCRAAKYDPRGAPPTDNLVSTNFNSRFAILDTGSSSTITYGTNFTSVSTVDTNALVKMLRVDCVWAYPRRGLFTNTVVTYRGPNQ
jgi:type II secretory pathway pseudopilin PulG